VQGVGENVPCSRFATYSNGAKGWEEVRDRLKRLSGKGNVEKERNGLAGWYEAFDVRCGSITFADLPWRAEL